MTVLRIPIFHSIYSKIEIAQLKSTHRLQDPTKNKIEATHQTPNPFEYIATFNAIGWPGFWSVARRPPLHLPLGAPHVTELKAIV
ncbi:hypothetical protein [Rhodoferax sp. WC2427]|uniref:hypothetical protein n=1 Tax=Rhodoferax sp. WC2427 TaxID=3234144 RepID=UPI003466B9E1